MLGGSTQHYKTYGKRKTNVINKRVLLFNASSPNQSNRGETIEKKVKSGGWSDSSDSSEDEAPTTRTKVEAKRTTTTPAKTKKVVVSKPRTSRFIGVEIIVADKENRRTSTVDRRRSTLSIAKKEEKGKDAVRERKVKEVDIESAEESSEPIRAPLKNKRKTVVRSRTVQVIESEDSTVEEAEVDASKEESDVEIVADQPILELDDTDVEDVSPTKLDAPKSSTFPFPVSLKALLATTLAADESKPFDFTSFVSTPPSPFVQPSTIDQPWRKVGEASYSEVFATTSSEGGRELVVKIIPIARPNSSGDDNSEEGERPSMSDWEAVKREIEISKAVGGDCGLEGFVRFRGAFLVQGQYPSSLLSSWDSFKRAQRPPCDDQIRPSTLPDDQLYALLLLDHAGQDLETWKVRNWREANEIWDQVVEHLARAEEDFEFEHRDLHWGNILIAPRHQESLVDQMSKLDLTPSKKSSTPRDSLSNPSPTVEVTLIDFTLSRLKLSSTESTASTRSRSSRGGRKAAETVLFDSFDDDCIFEGHGDRQFEVYRAMREVAEQSDEGWEGFHPVMNLLWLHYLVGKLLRSKKLKTPSPPPPLPSSSRQSINAFSPQPRAVSSPRKTRRQSLLLSTVSSPLSKPSTSDRKARTLPSNFYLTSATTGVKHTTDRQRREMELERRAFEGLQEAERWLEDVLGNLAKEGEEEPKRRIGRQNSTRRKGTKKVAVRVEESQKQGAVEFAKWWMERR